MKRVLLATALAALAGAGCRGPEAVQPGEGQLVVQGLQQTVRLTPAQPESGQSVQILSVVTSRSFGPAPVESRICGLDLGGDITIVMNEVRCGGYSQSVILAPGDSVTGVEGGVVGSPPGHYVLRVRQLVQPNAWVEIPVEVR